MIIAVIVLSLYAAGLTAATVYANYKRARGKAAMRGLFDELDEQLDAGEIDPIGRGVGFVATGMTITTHDAPIVDERTDEERRREYRDQIANDYTNALDDMQEAHRLGRRTDCLRQVVEGYRGALRNIYAEDAEALKDPTIVFEDGDHSCVSCRACGYDAPIGHIGPCAKRGVE